MLKVAFGNRGYVCAAEDANFELRRSRALWIGFGRGAGVYEIGQLLIDDGIGTNDAGDVICGAVVRYEFGSGC